MASSKVFLDANILVEIALERPKFGVIRKFLSNHPKNNHISALTAHLVVHFGKKHAELYALEALLSSFAILDMTTDDVTWAFRNVRDDDFEDALQLAVAVRNGCRHFLTLDKKLYKTYKNLHGIKVELAT